MARKQANGSKSANSRAKSRAEAVRHVAGSGTQSNEWFARFAHEAARLAGKPATFIIAVALILTWAATGPIFGYSDTWQLIINTSTTIITFLMVFVIQNTQNRDGLAIQVKLAELIIAVQGAKNAVATAEDMSEEELQKLHEHFRDKADSTLKTLEEKRVKSKK